MSGGNPQGVQVSSFKIPSSEDLNHGAAPDPMEAELAEKAGKKSRKGKQS